MPLARFWSSGRRSANSFAAKHDNTIGFAPGIGANTVNGKVPTASDPALFAMMFQQNWENARHIKNERIWFMNTYAVISAGILSLLQSIRGEATLELSLLFFMCLFSLLGLLTSFRLKAELEACLEKLEAMVAQAQAGEFVALEQSEGTLTRYPKFRWIFPVFYCITTTSFVALLVYRLAAGQPMPS